MLLDETHAFVAVVEAGSFTAAARQLGTRKSTLSRQVSRLEEHLGARLLHRTTRSLHPTETGAAYYERCRHAIADIREAERVALDVSGRPAGMLRVAAPFDFGRDHLSSALPDFRARYPEVDVTVVLGQGAVDLVAEGFDVALRGGALTDSGMICRKIYGMYLGLFASPAYLDARGRPETVDDLEGHDGVVMTRQGRPWVPRVPGPDGEPRALALEPVVAANEWVFLSEQVCAGLGIGVLSSSEAVPLIAAGRLERVLPSVRFGDGWLYAVYPSRHHLTPKVRVFVDFVAERFRDLDTSE